MIFYANMKSNALSMKLLCKRCGNDAGRIFILRCDFSFVKCNYKIYSLIFYAKSMKIIKTIYIRL